MAISLQPLCPRCGLTLPPFGAPTQSASCKNLGRALKHTPPLRLKPYGQRGLSPWRDEIFSPWTGSPSSLFMSIMTGCTSKSWTPSTKERPKAPTTRVSLPPYAEPLPRLDCNNHRPHPATTKSALIVPTPLIPLILRTRKVKAPSVLPESQGTLHQRIHHTRGNNYADTLAELGGGADHAYQISADIFFLPQRSVSTIPTEHTVSHTCSVDTLLLKYANRKVTIFQVNLSRTAALKFLFFSACAVNRHVKRLIHQR